jgi:hypothetical protein
MHRNDGRLVAISDEAICEYASQVDQTHPRGITKGAQLISFQDETRWKVSYFLHPTRRQPPNPKPYFHKACSGRVTRMSFPASASCSRSA